MVGRKARSRREGPMVNPVSESHSTYFTRQYEYKLRMRCSNIVKPGTCRWVALTLKQADGAVASRNRSITRCKNDTWDHRTGAVALQTQKSHFYSPSGTAPYQMLNCQHSSSSAEQQRYRQSGGKEGDEGGGEWMLYSHQQRPRLAERRQFLGRSRARTTKVAGKVKFEAQANSRLASAGGTFLEPKL